MNPSKKGWLKEFIDNRIQHFKSEQALKKAKIGQDPDHSFYGIIQPTGIMYGFPVQSIDTIDTSAWSNKSHIKVLLINSLIDIAELYSQNSTGNSEEYSENLMRILENVTTFYEKVYPEISISSKTWLGKKKETLELVEGILEKRVKSTANGNNNFWLSFFNKSQLFLDIYIFGQWTHTQPDEVLQEFFKSEKEELSYNAVKVMSAAAHANSQIEEEEEALFTLFINSSGMSSEKKHVAKEYFEHGIGIQDIPIEDSDPWIIRKFFVELALLTIWSDKKVEESELEFIARFNDKLGFNPEDLDKSTMAVEGFVLENWSHLDSLQGKKDFEEVSQSYLERLSSTAQNFKNRIAHEVAEDNRLVELIKKGNASELAAEETEIIRQKLLKILKGIPAFSIIALPESFLTYKNILKVIPKEVFTAISDK